MLFPLSGVPVKYVSLATTNATLLKGGPCRLQYIYCTNTNAAVRYLKFFNKATAPVVGTDVPVILLAIPLTGSIVPIVLPMGFGFDIGLGFCMTTGVADTDVAAVGAGDLILNYAFIN